MTRAATQPGRRDRQRVAIAQSPPESVAELRMLILARQLSFPDQLRRIIEIGLAQPDVIAFGTVTSIAAECRVASSTVMRLPGFLGMRSVREVKRLFQNELVERNHATFASRSPSDCIGNDANGSL